VNFSPTAKLIVVHPHFTELTPSFGVKQGDATRFEFEVFQHTINLIS
jgi:hypothetical protein